MGLAKGAQRRVEQVWSVVQAEQADFPGADSERRERRVHQDRGEPHGAAVVEVERSGGADADRSRGSEYDDIAFVMKNPGERAADSGDEGRPRFTGVFEAALDPGPDYFLVAVVPLPVNGMIVSAAAGFDFELHLFVLAAEIVIGGGKVRSHSGINLREIEFVPAFVDDDVRAGENFGRRGSLSGETSGIDRVELDLLPGEIVPEEAGLLPSGSGKRVVVFAGAGLAVADEIENHQ